MSDEELEESENVSSSVLAVVGDEEDTLDTFFSGDSILLADLKYKNTRSFRCLTQVEISRSSLLLDPFYWFPEIEDPNLDAALWNDGMSYK